MRAAKDRTREVHSKRVDAVHRTVVSWEPTASHASPRLSTPTGAPPIPGRAPYSALPSPTHLTAQAAAHGTTQLPHGRLDSAGLCDDLRRSRPSTAPLARRDEAVQHIRSRRGPQRDRRGRHPRSRCGSGPARLVLPLAPSRETPRQPGHLAVHPRGPLGQRQGQPPHLAPGGHRAPTGPGAGAHPCQYARHSQAPPRQPARPGRPRRRRNGAEVHRAGRCGRGDRGTLRAGPQAAGRRGECSVWAGD